MDIVPKSRLVDGLYYEGFTADAHEEPRVAKWNAERNEFEYVWHRWGNETYLVPMVYWDESSEYFELFQPVSVTEPRDFEKVENV